MYIYIYIYVYIYTYICVYICMYVYIYISFVNPNSLLHNVLKSSHFRPHPMDKNLLQKVAKGTLPSEAELLGGCSKLPRRLCRIAQVRSHPVIGNNFRPTKITNIWGRNAQ